MDTPHRMTPLTTLTDTFGRVHNNLRISVTDRCNLRCVYCMPEDVTFLDRSELLSFEEIRDFVSVALPLGINKVRLTGGEPLLRKDLPKLVSMLTALPGLDDLGLTTNGLLLARDAAALQAAGLKRLNVSLDTLDAERFRELSRRDGLNLVLAGLTEARRLGFEKIKINAVAMRGYIEADLVPLAKYCREMGFELRLIEYMPIGAEAWEREKCVLAHELLEILDREVSPLVPAAHYDPHAPAQDFAYADGQGTLGIIASVSRPFCRSCNRIRLTAEGKLRNCLFALDETPVKHLLRPLQPDLLQAAIQANVQAKWEGHEINSAKFVKPLRTMHAIGG
ncbi:MAG: GTP 3',8-cyclase MoaA [Fimbriiglobus sp.]